MARRRTRRAARYAGYGAMGRRSRTKKFAGWKTPLKAVAVGIGAASATQLVLNRAGINVPYVKYVPSFMLGGTVGLVGAVAFDYLTGSMTLGGTTAGGPVV